MIAEELLSVHRESSAALQVVPIIGITSTLNTLPVEANVVAMDVARAYGGLSAQLPCPAFIDDKDRADAIMTLRQVREMLETIRRCNAVVTGMGAIGEDGDDSDITISNDPVMNAYLIRLGRAAGAIAEICYWLFNGKGDPVETSHEAIGLGFKRLQELARDRSRDVILACGGDRRRFHPLRVALGAGLASVLVSDTVTAQYLVGEIHVPKSASRP
jgi:DNA-binding transcriptional regulator LsrR (DeoR family)